MKKNFFNNDFLFKVSYLQFLLYQDNFFTLYEREQIENLIDKLISVLERGE